MTADLTRVLGAPWRRINAFLVQRKKASLDLEQERARSLRWLEEHCDVDAKALHEEYRESDFRHWFLERRAELPTTSQTSSAFDCETLYLVVRTVQPDVVVETGVLFGAFSGHILAALQRNGEGRLVSIDLPNEPGAPDRDHLVRDSGDASRRWRVVEGNAEEELETVCEEVGPLDLFNHDSDHRYSHQKWELETAATFLSESGIITSHDVLSSSLQRNAFDDFCEERARECACFRNLGAALIAPVPRRR